uniref:C3H1-type domain-containing protein n=1 Tax=Zooxanthella nutricula TaxID=1333877 RepID=A0A7S2LD71_9DINO
MTPSGGADAPPRQRLNSKAQAWTPGGASAMQPRGGAAGLSSMQIGAFLQQFAALVSAAAAAVQQALGGADVQASDGPSGLAIVVQLPLAEFQQRRDEALAFARQALLQAARAAGNKVHVLGSMGNPFVATPFGCSAMLGAVADEKQACWDSLAHGYCHRGHACRWQHPLCRSTVNIMVKIAEG